MRRLIYIFTGIALILSGGYGTSVSDESFKPYYIVPEYVKKKSERGKLIVKGSQAMKELDFERGKDYFSRALEMDSDPYTLKSLAVCLLKTGVKVHDCSPLLFRAREMDPDDSDIHYYLGFIMTEIGYYWDAELYFNDAMSANVNDPDPVRAVLEISELIHGNKTTRELQNILASKENRGCRGNGKFELLTPTACTWDELRYLPLDITNYYVPKGGTWDHVLPLSLVPDRRYATSGNDSSGQRQADTAVSSENESGFGLSDDMFRLMMLQMMMQNMSSIPFDNSTFSNSSGYSSSSPRRIPCNSCSGTGYQTSKTTNSWVAGDRKYNAATGQLDLPVT